MSCSRNSIIILGIDPGTSITGYGVIACQGCKIQPLDYGCIRPPSTLDLNNLYLIIYEGLEALIEQHKPDCLAIVFTLFLWHFMVI